MAGKQENESKRRRERKAKKRGSKEAKQETKLSRRLSGTNSPVQGEITNAELKLFSSCLYLYLAVALFFLFSLFLRVDVSVSSVDVSVNKPDRFMSLLAFSAELYNCTCTIACESVDTTNLILIQYK